MSLLTPIIAIFNAALQPVAPFTWFNISISTLDVAAAFRLCLILRQLKESLHKDHISKHGLKSIESRSFARDVSTTLTVVYGGEVMTAPFLGVPPSFMISGVVPVFYTVVQAIVEMLPSVPPMTIHTELPLAVLDGFTRAFLLCNLIPPPVTANSSPLLASSPWTLLVTSLVAANGGFFLTNLFSFLNPTPLALQTPPELQAYGWTTTDLWCAPLITGIYALLTHAQPFWVDVHTVLSSMLGGSVAVSEKGGSFVEPVDPDTARAACAAILATFFVVRSVKNFAPQLWQKKAEKLKTQ
ncbi:unnamed protein product [Mycena citricolor]|uniref:Uncharacterized protein n=1 Tax=Mycena citricolor TaxID=2018698 RepID=A0AAD2HJE0_9AGAR|nr:unnamed protein product [Mycena citricolor]